MTIIRLQVIRRLLLGVIGQLRTLVAEIDAELAERGAIRIDRVSIDNHNST